MFFNVVIFKERLDMTALRRRRLEHLKKMSFGIISLIIILLTKYILVIIIKQNYIIWDHSL